MSGQDDGARAEAREREAIVIGAGPAGLAAAAMLRRAGVDTLVVERSEAVAASWRAHYDRLHLHTVRWLSHLPGLRFSRRHGRWVPRDGVVRYLEAYVRHHGLEVRTGTKVERLEREGERWVLRTPAGDLRARHVVVATGYNHTPHLPDWPGMDEFEGELLHASRYRNAEPYRGRDVLVVGTGNTGAEIAVDLVEGGAGRVRIAVRTPPNVVLRELNGVPSQVTGLLMRRLPPRVADALSAPVTRAAVGDLTPYGLAEPEVGPFTRVRRDDVVPIIDVGLIDLLRAGRVTAVAGVEGFRGREVLLADGSAIEPDAVVAATGYTRGLDALVGHLGLVGEKGRPVVRGGRTHPNAPGLRFIGYTNPISGMFRELGIEARRIARAVRRELRSGEPAPAAAERPLAGAGAA
jgi:putative flavoprotein involved in K+ transport